MNIQITLISNRGCYKKMSVSKENTKKYIEGWYIMCELTLFLLYNIDDMLEII